MYKLGNRMDVELYCISHRINCSKQFSQKNRPTSSFVYYVKGGQEFEFTDYKISAVAGMMVYLPCGSSYTNRILSDDTEYYQIEFNVYDNGITAPLFDKAKVITAGDGNKYLSLVLESYSLYSKHDYAYNVLCMSSIIKIIGLFVKDETQQKANTYKINRISNTLTYIEEFYNLETPISELARLSSTSVSNLEKIFNQQLGVSPTTYRNTIRVEHAKQLLARGYSIQEAAQLTGFSDRYYFSKVFKKLTGITPGNFINLY